MMPRAENHGRAVEYLRRSVERDKSADKDRGAGQRAANAAQAARDGVIIARSFDGDWGISGGRGKREYRHAMAELIDAIRAGEVSRVYCHTTDRLARDVEYGMALWNACKDAGTILRPGSQTFDPQEPGYLTLWTVLLAQAEEDLDRMTRKNHDQIDYGRDHALTCPLPGRPHLGRCHLVGCTDKTHCSLSHERGRKPYGTMPEEDAAAVVTAFLEAGSLNGAARILNDRGVPTKTPGGRWSARTIKAVVERTTPGTVPYGGRRGARTVARRALAGLLHCGGTVAGGATCGHVLTSKPRPAATRRDGTPRQAITQWICPDVVNTTTHSRPQGISEARLLPAIMAESLHYRAPADEFTAAERTSQRDKLTADLARVQRLAISGVLDEDQAAAEAKSIRAQLAALDHAAAPVAIPQAISWSAPAAELNGWLRALWPEGIELDSNLLPVRYSWLPGWRRD